MSSSSRRLLNFVASVLAPDAVESALAARQAQRDPQMPNALLRSLVRATSGTTTAAAAPLQQERESRWLGANAEEEAKVNEYLSFNEEYFGEISPLADISDAPLAALDERLAKEAFLAGGASYTLADCVLYWSLATKVLNTPPRKAQVEKSFRNIIRWFDQMQNVIAERTGSPALYQFKIEAIQKTLSGFEPSNKSAVGASAAATAAVAGGSPKNKKKKTETVAAPAVEVAKPDAPAATAPAPAESAIAPPAETAVETAGGEDSKKKKKEKEKKEKPAAAQEAAVVVEQPEITKLVIKVGKILKASKHPSSDKLVVEEIDLGEGTPRTICSGILEYYPDPEVLVGKLVCVVTNLKPRKMAGVESNGMVLAGSSVPTEEEAAKGEGKKVVLCQCHPESKPGEVIFFAGIEPGKFEPYTDKQVDKKEVLQSTLPNLFTTENCEVVWKDPSGMIHHFMSSSGTVSVPHIPQGRVS